MTKDAANEERTWTEEFIVAGTDLVDKVKKLVEQGNVRRLIIRKPGGEALLEVPLTAGAVVGGTLVIMAPVLAAIGALAALLTEVRVDVVRVDEGGEGE